MRRQRSTLKLQTGDSVQEKQCSLFFRQGRKGAGMVKKIRKKMKRREILWAYLMLAPALALFLTFVLIPLISTFFISFYKWDMLTPAKFIGWKNFETLLGDQRLRTVIGNTLFLAVAAVVLKLAIGLALAAAVHSVRSKRLTSVLESVFFFPIILPMSIVAIVWGMLLNTDMGVINGMLSAIGLGKVPWLTDPKFSLMTITLLDVWKGAGFFFIIYLVAMRNVPRDLYEAAEIDGAGKRQKFFSITLPMISPTSLFLTIQAIIGSLQVFDQAQILTNGGPGDSSTTMVLYIYQNAFQRMNMGYGTTLALLLFVFIMIVTIAQMVLSKKWVFYN